MKACPNCGNPATTEAAVCECGELLRAEVTHVQAWETETVFGGRPAKTPKRNLGSAFALVMGLTILGVAWIGVRQNLITTNTARPDDPATSHTQNPAVSNTDQTDQLSPASSSQEGVFVFSEGNRPANPERASRVQSGKVEIASTTASAPLSQPPDSKLTQSETLPTTAADAPKADCKPDVSLRRAEPSAPIAEQKPQAPKPAESTRTYILGPRGGCFFVTAGGGKKYVDRGLCPQTAAVGARQ